MKIENTEKCKNITLALMNELEDAFVRFMERNFGNEIEVPLVVGALAEGAHRFSAKIASLAMDMFEDEELSDSFLKFLNQEFNKMILANKAA